MASPTLAFGKELPTQLQLAGFQRIQATSHPMLVLFSPLFLAFFHTNLFKLGLSSDLRPPPCKEIGFPISEKLRRFETSPSTIIFMESIRSRQRFLDYIIQNLDDIYAYIYIYYIYIQPRQTNGTVGKIIHEMNLLNDGISPPRKSLIRQQSRLCRLLGEKPLFWDAK